jgi:hypothetical protein
LSLLPPVLAAAMLISRFLATSSESHVLNRVDRT